MSVYNELHPENFLPDYYSNLANSRRREQGSVSFCKSLLIHIIAMTTAIGLCTGAYYYYQQVYIPMQKQKLSADEDSKLTQKNANNIEAGFQALKSTVSSEAISFCENVVGQIDKLQEALNTMSTWRTTVNSHLTKIQWEQDIKTQNAVEEALAIYEADGIGIMDYAASYAGGIIVGLTRETQPHPTHKLLSLFKIYNVDVPSSPEEIIRPCMLPGSCFAFRGDQGSIRIKLGKPINIAGVTLSHASRFLLGLEGMSSAPKEFEVHGFTNIADESGIFLGKFTFDWMGKQHQYFAVKTKLSKNHIFEDIELSILSNYGKQDFTCVYRFRVHKSDVETTEKSTQSHGATADKKKCC